MFRNVILVIWESRRFLSDISLPENDFGKENGINYNSAQSAKIDFKIPARFFVGLA